MGTEMCFGLKAETRQARQWTGRSDTASLTGSNPVRQHQIADELARCDAEIAALEREMRAGNPEVEGLARAIIDWSIERRMILECNQSPAS